MSDGPSFRTLVASFSDFLVVAIHTILYERRIYPQTSFISARKYNFAVRQNRHPKVCEWINDSVAAVESELLKGTVELVAVVIYSKQSKPLERFVFDVTRFPNVPTAELDVPLERAATDGTKTNILPAVDLEEQLRATMSKLSNCSSSLKDLPKGCTFTVAIELKGEGNAPLGHPQAWIPSESQPGQNSEPKEVEDRTTPIRAVRAGEMMFETWIEQREFTSTPETSSASTG